MPSYLTRDGRKISDTCVIETDGVGKHTSIWHNTVVMEGAKIGENCIIGSHCVIGRNVVIGNNCRIQDGCLIYEGVTIGESCLIAPNVTFTNDYFPTMHNVKDWKKDRFKKTRVERLSSIGAGSVILCGVTIGENSVVGAGSVVTKNVCGFTIVAGNPAKRIRKRSDYDSEVARLKEKKEEWI